MQCNTTQLASLRLPNSNRKLSRRGHEIAEQFSHESTQKMAIESDVFQTDGGRLFQEVLSK